MEKDNQKVGLRDMCRVAHSRHVVPAGPRCRSSCSQ